MNFEDKIKIASIKKPILESLYYTTANSMVNLLDRFEYDELMSILEEAFMISWLKNHTDIHTDFDSYEACYNQLLDDALHEVANLLSHRLLKSK